MTSSSPASELNMWLLILPSVSQKEFDTSHLTSPHHGAIRAVHDGVLSQ
jgi:hypothetical protein